MTPVRVIGAGLSGLATAWYLTDAGARVHVFEAADRPGGLIQTQRLSDGLIEMAARAFTGSERARALFAAVGVEACDTLPESRRRFIFRDGRLRRWPLSIGETLGAATRAASAWIRRDMRPHDRESVADWGRRVAGPATTTWLIGPALQGIYATTPDVLSASAIFGGRRPGGGGKLFAPRTGMGELIDRLEAGLRERGVTLSFGTPVDQIDPSTPTVICTEAPAAARLLAPHAPSLAAAIGRIRMVSLLVVTAFFEPDPSDWHGFGVLFPRSSGVDALGVLCNTDMFPDRGAGRSETWIYGEDARGALPSPLTIAERVASDRARLTGRRVAPVSWHVTPQIDALPVYDQAIVDAMAALGELPTTIAIAGNYLGRLGVSKLLDGAAEATARIFTVGTNEAMGQ